MQDPLLLNAHGELGTPQGMRETIETAGRAIVNVATFPELAGRGGRFELVLRSAMPH